MPSKFCVCLPLQTGYHIVGVLCCLTVLVGLILLFSDALWGWGISLGFGVSSAFWLISLIRPAIIHKKIFTYSFVVLSLLFETGGAIMFGIVLNLLVTAKD